EEQQLNFLSTTQSALESFLGLVTWRLSGDVSARQAALDVWLRRKGILLEAQRRFQEALLYGDNPEAIKVFQELARIRAELSQLIFTGPEKESPEVYTKKIADLEETKNSLEAKLSSLSQAYAQSKKTQRADTQKVAAVLPLKSVLLEFVRIREQNFQAKGGESMWRPAHYLAFILPARQPDKLNLVDLGPAEAIDQAVTDLKKAIEKTEDPTGRQVTPPAQNLYNLVFSKLKTAIGGARDIFISPDGQLNLIPFE
ncbi:MAG: hypothetical protein HQK55_10105, partial [Deltaproteobacteria bacterium]|nr:hypothetical protein [Deltaproteobacteria bacterium]